MIRKNDKGITLIALVVTIIVLIILATVSINMVVGENGLIKKAEQARDAYEESSKKEVEGINTMLEEMMKETGVGPHGLPLVDTLGRESSNVVLESTVNAEDVNGNKIVVPRGFFVRTDLGTKVNDGIVIEDKQRNQFVWVPCTEEQYKKHEYKNQNADDTKGSTPDSGENPWKTHQYRHYTDWTEEGGNKESVKENGGFYVGRYEAGVPKNASFYVDKNSENKEYNRDSGTTHSKNVSQENVTKLKPVSKQGVQAWNYISQTNAIEVSKNMYSGAESSYGVTSSLIDGIAWDRTVEWIAGEKEKASIVIDSKKYGNYTDTTNITLPEETLYAQHALATAKNNSNSRATIISNKYKTGAQQLGEIELNNTEESTKYNSADYTNGEKYTLENYTLSRRVEMATGAVGNFELKNIYDMAGNMWEWTTETGYHNTSLPAKTSGTKYAVLHGGCFNSYGDVDSISCRSGNEQVNNSFVNVGFRVVLYIN